MSLSAASKRAQSYPKDQGEWFCKFKYRDVKGIGYEEGVCRRDPSNLLQIGDTYYVWYTKSVGEFNPRTTDLLEKRFPWDYAEIWYATSKDGIDWEEKGCAVGLGGKGAYDERTVCTPDITKHDGKYYLVYQCMHQDGVYEGVYEKVAMAIADSPDGPFVKLDAPILERTPDGRVFDDKDNYNDSLYKGAVHDPTLFFYKNKFYLYYKCALVLHDTPTHKFAGGDTRWGVAIADNITGPYVPSEFNPITNSGHETMIWEHNGGMACLINRDGPEKDTIQFAPDGINFEIMAHVSDTPIAAGALKLEKQSDDPLDGIKWGLFHPLPYSMGTKWNYIRRFDMTR